MASMDLEEALGIAFTLLLERGVADPEEYLRGKRILD
jgi:hypothetical protein